jgi:HD-like signal output (HDOD) protein
MTASTTEIDAETEKIVRTIGIPPCPKIVLEFMQEMRKEDADVRRLAELISSDPGLAAAVLKTANSPTFGLKTKVGTVQQAFTVLGMRPTSMLVSSMLLKRSFPVSQSNLIEEFWRNSATTAMYSAALAPMLVQVDRHVAYTYGLFRDCGQAIMLINYPKYRGIFTGEAVPPDTTVVAVENKGFPTNHANIGGVLAKSWYLSDVICGAILSHHDAANLAAGQVAPSQASMRLIAVGILADQIQSMHQTGKPHREWAAGKSLVTAQLGIDEAGLASIAAMLKASDVAIAA